MDVRAYPSKTSQHVAVPWVGGLQKFAKPEQTFEVNGHGKFFRLPFTPESYRVLRNLGVKVANPVFWYYDFPIQRGRTPFKSQLQTVDLITGNPRSYVLSDMATGKTLAALWGFDWLRRQGLVNRALIVCPLSTMVPVWELEIFEVMPQYSVSVLHGTAAKRRKLFAQPHDIYVLNHDGVKVLANELAARRDIDMAIIDELSAFKDHRTDRWKVMNRILNRTMMPKFVVGMTGTPTPNSPTDAYAQGKLITPATAPKTYGRFEDATTIKITEFKRVPKADANERVKELLTPAIRAKRGIDIPPTTYSYREVAMTSVQKKAYDMMVKHFHVEMGEGSITAANEGVKLSKLVQIGCGFGYGENGQTIRLPGGETRTPVIKEILEQAQGKVIIFTPFRASTTIIAEGLGLKRHGAGWEFVGSGPEVRVLPRNPRHRPEVFMQFQMGTKLKGLLAHAKMMSHGLTLTAADTIIWVAPFPSLETFLQANGRIARPGQRRNTHIIMLYGSKAEKMMYDRLKRNEALQGALLTLLEQEG